MSLSAPVVQKQLLPFVVIVVHSRSPDAEAAGGHNLYLFMIGCITVFQVSGVEVDRINSVPLFRVYVKV